MNDPRSLSTPAAASRKAAPSSRAPTTRALEILKVLALSCASLPVLKILIQTLHLCARGARHGTRLR